MDASSKDLWEQEEDAHPCNPTNNPTLASMMAARLSRRSLLKAAGTGLLMFGVGSLDWAPNADAQSPGGFVPITPSSADKLIVPSGYGHTVLLRWGDPLVAGLPTFDPMAQTAATQAQQFGYNCDFIGYLPLPPGSNSSRIGLLGVNHESTSSTLMFPGWDRKLESKTREVVEIEIAAHGFSVVEVGRGNRREWTYAKDSPYNRRITGTTPMAIRGPAASHRTHADGRRP